MASGEKLDLIHHVSDDRKIDLEFIDPIYLPEINVFGLDMSITKHLVFMWIASALMIIIFVGITRRDHLVPRGIRNFFEFICVFIKEFVAEPFLGEDTDAYLPLLWTMFFFIWFCNMLGLIPFGATATGNIMVTGALALIIFVVAHGMAILRHGPGGYIGALVPHVPAWLWPMMFVIEILGWFAKIMALAIRLFANMVAGHIIILGFLGLTFIFKSHLVGTVSVVASVAIGCLELFVAALQAFVFTFLSAVFIGMMLHPDH